ncbi:DUF4468 domain-containing protein [uncultured Sunxiuqinia sp.]|uniref:DUF4468 domain-containing protein n=1 Tax=uncultured Sunxiuqinia sp. TaxID=1573825 RepID=UPI0026062ACB|nr:DUF4468 domain-containing protein [uncultured Sunxiuqinia sp.]
MKSILLAVMVVLPFLVKAQSPIDNIPFVDGEVKFETILNVEGSSAESLYADTKLIISDIYKSGKAAIDVSDDDALFIVVKGITYYPFKDWLGTVAQKLDHTLKFQFKDGRMKVTLFDLEINTIPIECVIRECKGYRFNKRMRETHAREILKTWENMQSQLISGLEKDQDDW